MKVMTGVNNVRRPRARCQTLRSYAVDKKSITMGNKANKEIRTRAQLVLQHGATPHRSIPQSTFPKDTNPKICPVRPRARFSSPPRQNALPVSV